MTRQVEREPRTIISAQVDTTTRAELERLAATADRTLSAEVRRAINEHIRQEQQPAEQGAR
jgi:hypothetical protein